MKKYALTNEVIGPRLHRIVALRDIPRHGVKAGDLGGFVESESNLSQKGDAWIAGNACAFADARVSGNACVSGKARISGDARIYGDARVAGEACVSGEARISGYTQIFGDAKVCSSEDYIVFKNWWDSGRYFTWTRSNNMWKVGDFYGTGEELIVKAEKHSKLSGREYKRVIDYVESILKDEED